MKKEGGTKRYPYQGSWDICCSDLLAAAFGRWLERVQGSPVIHIPQWIGCLDEDQELHLNSDASEALGQLPLTSEPLLD